MRSLGINTTTLAPSISAFAASPPRSAWHSPVSYLFGGLAAMTGLIAFALLILACSYCHLSRTGDDDNDNDRRRRQGDVEQGKTGEGDVTKVSPVFEDKFLVIMAGHHVPTFLATPRLTKASVVSPGDGDLNPKVEEEREGVKNGQVDREESSSHVLRSNNSD